MTSTLSIAITADPFLPVPPLKYGGIERVIQFLVDGLVDRGHRVVLVAHRDSRVRGELISYPADQNRSVLNLARNAATVGATVLRDHFDVVHSFGRLNYLVPLALTSTPKIMSYQRPITVRSIRAARRVFGSTLEFTACSRWMIGDVDSLAVWHVVFNGVPIASYEFREHVAGDAPLVFLGRIERIKGVHLAIEAARRSGRSLILAGNVEPEHQPYFDEYVRPFLSDRIQYVGPVDDAAKNELLGSAAALLMPVLWDEPFGIVMVEALACGTPVIGLARGAVPEVIKHGITGFVVQSPGDIPESITRLKRINRRNCRTDAVARFSDRVIVSQYESLYHALLEKRGRPVHRQSRDVAPGLVKEGGPGERGPRERPVG